jgi:putative addiction module component (TIGR02574 family)
MRKPRAWSATAVLASQATLVQNEVMAKPALDLSKLTAEEKFELLDDLWQSLAGDDLTLTPEIDAELDRRLDRLEREGPSGIPWEDVRQEMSARKT